MQVNDALIDKLARLSMLSIPDEEREGLKKDLQKMIGFFDKLKELDTTGVAPLLHMSAPENTLRADEPGDMLPREKALQNAPLHDGVHFHVPKVIKKGES